MSTEIATWNMIRSKIPTFPSPSSGRENECLTKAEIQSLGGENLSINGNYSNIECVILDHIEKVTWVYTFSIQPASLNFAALGGTQLVTVTSYKEKRINDIPTGIRENVGFDSSPSGGWLSSGGTSVTVSENTVASSRAGSVMYTQHESGNPGQIMVGQDEGIMGVEYSLSSSSAFPAPRIGGEGSVQIISNKHNTINGKPVGDQTNISPIVNNRYGDWMNTTRIDYNGYGYLLKFSCNSNNTGRARIAQVELRQPESNDTITVNCPQLG